jgi:hypothetical protein
MRLQVGWLALPPDSGEEEVDACLAFGAAVVNDVAEGQVGGVDQDACFLARSRIAPWTVDSPASRCPLGRHS